MVCFVPVFAQAWGPDGHRITGEIAAQHLTPEAAAAVAELLGDESLAESTVWADEIKSDRPETRPLHYMNAPEGVRKVTRRHCSEDGCVLSATIKNVSILKSKRRSREEKVEALKFLAHFVGDLHTPLHLGRAADKGGNDIRVEFQGSFTNLHRLWDSGFLRSTRVFWPEYAERLNAEITEEQAEDWSPIDYEVWATESYKLCREFAYPIPKSMVIEDDPEYTGRAIEIIDQQLAKGGVRLAAVLNDIFR